MAYVDCDGCYANETWSVNMLKVIGITPENPDGINTPPVIAKTDNSNQPTITLPTLPPIATDSASAPPVIAPPVIYRNEEEKANISEQFRQFTPQPRKGW